jgi:hypothetical protein
MRNQAPRRPQAVRIKSRDERGGAAAALIIAGAVFCGALGSLVYSVPSHSEREPQAQAMAETRAAAGEQRLAAEEAARQRMRRDLPSAEVRGDDVDAI